MTWDNSEKENNNKNNIATKFSTFICYLVFALKHRGKEQEIFFKDLSSLVVVSV